MSDIDILIQHQFERRTHDYYEGAFDKNDAGEYTDAQQQDDFVMFKSGFVAGSEGREEELMLVINNKFHYLNFRSKLAELTGIPTMAITTDEHIKRLGQKLWEYEKEIERLRNKVKDAKERLA